MSDAMFYISILFIFIGIFGLNRYYFEFKKAKDNDTLDNILSIKLIVSSISSIIAGIILLLIFFGVRPSPGGCGPCPRGTETRARAPPWR